MSASNVAEAAFLDLLFLNIDFAGIGDVTGLLGSAGAGNFFISLHTSDPGEGGDQSTNEMTYTGHTRASVPRDGTGFSRTGSVVTNVGVVSWGTNAGSIETATYFGIGTLSSGAGKLIVSGALTSPLSIVPGLTPQAAAGTLAITFD